MDRLMKFASERLEQPDHLKGGVKFVDKIPRNLLGKILRHQMRNAENWKKKKYR